MELPELTPVLLVFVQVHELFSVKLTLKTSGIFASTPAITPTLYELVEVWGSIHVTVVGERPETAGWLHFRKWSFIFPKWTFR